MGMEDIAHNVFAPGGKNMVSCRGPRKRPAMRSVGLGGASEPLPSQSIRPPVRASLRAASCLTCLTFGGRCVRHEKRKAAMIVL